jgi:hypothetical protein
MAMGCDVYEVRRVRCRKPHRCAYCGEPIAAGEEALLEHGIYEGDPFSRYACQDCEPFLEGFWDWCDCESADIPSDFSCYREVVRMEAQECAEMAEAMKENR